MTVQNISHAVMAQRHEPIDSLDDFPTHPWAVRALIEEVLDPVPLRQQSAFEPAVGRGHIIRTLAEYFGATSGSDIYDYGAGYPVLDFMSPEAKLLMPADWIITNPPFKKAEEFVHRSLRLARIGVAILVRTVFIEGVRRYWRLYSTFPPVIVAQFSERVPLVRGRLDRTASSATAYAWVIWDCQNRSNRHTQQTDLVWIRPCRKMYERPGDYEDAVPL